MCIANIVLISFISLFLIYGQQEKVLPSCHFHAAIGYMKKIVIVCILFGLFSSEAFSFRSYELYRDATLTPVYVIINGLLVGDEIEELLAANPHISLFHRRHEEKYGTMSPWLFQLQHDSHLMKWLDERPCIARQSLFLKSHSFHYEIMEHLQRFHIVASYSGDNDEKENLYLRWYDPSVFATLMTVLDADQRNLFFGPVRDYFAWNPLDGTYRRYSMEGGRFTYDVLRLEEDGPCEYDIIVNGRTELVNRYPQLWTFNQSVPRMVPFAQICSCESENICDKEPLLSISTEQYRHLGEYQMAKFRYRLYWDLRRGSEAAALDDLVLREYVDAGVPRGRKYGLTNEGEIHTFVRAMVIFGKDFDTLYPWAREILESSDYSASDKRRKLEALIELKKEKGDDFTGPEKVTQEVPEK